MKELSTPDYYTPVVSREGNLIEREDFIEQRIWAKTNIVAIVAIVALVYMVDSNNRREIEIAKTKVIVIEKPEPKKENDLVLHHPTYTPSRDAR